MLVKRQIRTSKTVHRKPYIEKPYIEKPYIEKPYIEKPYKKFYISYYS
ncbi:MAG: hypothetical protein ACE5OZ_20010 [Candidatus Heimdallarchaeota archaeon]